MAAARHLRHQDRGARAREHPARRGARRREASIDLGDLRASAAGRRSGHGAEARARLDPALRLVHPEIPHDPGRARRRAPRRSKTHDGRAKEAAAMGRQIVIFPEGTRRPPERRPTTSRVRRRSISASAFPACRSRSTPASTGRGANSCAIRAPSSSSSCPPFRPACHAGNFPPPGNRDRDRHLASRRGGAEQKGRLTLPQMFYCDFRTCSDT